jgi:asparagine synthase (glutamine-hydrolysing)
MADVPLALMASGGIDSGLLWWALRDALDRAFCVRWEAGADAEGLADDEAAVRATHELFGTPVGWIDGDRSLADVELQSGDLIADPAVALTATIARAARADGIKVLFSGQGGDELFAGYRRHMLARLLRARAVTPAPVLGLLQSASLPIGPIRQEYAARMARALSAPDDLRGYLQLCTYSTSRERAEVLGCAEAEVADEVVWQRHIEVHDSLDRGLPPLRRFLEIDRRVYLPGLGLAYADRAGMAHGVEVRVPWLDIELVDWSLELPVSVLQSRRRGKVIPRALAAAVLTSALAHRPKRGFAAPFERLTPTNASGERGFRQGTYFARAADLARAHISTGPAWRRSA